MLDLAFFGAFHVFWKQEESESELKNIFRNLKEAIASLTSAANCSHLHGFLWGEQSDGFPFLDWEMRRTSTILYQMQSF